MTRPGTWLVVSVMLAATVPVAAESGQVCSAAPYEEDRGEISALVRLLMRTLEPHPSLSAALLRQAPTLCLDDGLYEEQAYFEPATNRIVLRADLDPDLQLAILIHEARHLEQFGRGSCPTIKTTLSDYVRSRLAMEADAAAVSIHVTWGLRADGNPGPWDSLRNWPTQTDLVARYEAEMEASGDATLAVAATFAQWFERADRRALYARAICSNYLDALDQKKQLPGSLPLSSDFAATLCVLPDGRPYDCVLPP